MELPTLNVPDDKADHIVQAFGTKENYKRWLKASLRDELRRRIGWQQIEEAVSEIVPPEPEQPEDVAVDAE